MTQSLGKTVGLPIGVPLMKVSVHEDNAGELILAKTFTQKCPPLSKYYATNTIWFCEKTNKNEGCVIENYNSLVSGIPFH